MMAKWRNPRLCENLQTWLIVAFIRVLGLAPFKLGKDRPRSRRSRLLSLYGLVVAILMFLNMYFAENDSSNNDMFENVSLLIGIAYDSVDVFGAVYVCYSFVRGLFQLETSISAWFRCQSIDARLSYYRITFNYQKLRTYICVKIVVVTILIAIFMSTDIVGCARMNIYYTSFLWITVLYPFAHITYVTVLFGCFALVLYQRYWVINRCLQDSIENLPLNELSTIVWSCESYKRIRMQPHISRPKKVPFHLMLKNADTHFLLCDTNLSKTIQTLKEIHFELYQATKEFNNSYGYHFIFHFIFFFFSCSINLYYVVIFHLRPFEMEQYVISCMWTLSVFSLAIYSVLHSNLISNEVCTPAKPALTIPNM